MKKDSVAHIIVVTLAVCFVCSIAVSMAAVLLRDQQNINSELARKRNILIAANVIDPQKVTPAEVEDIFSRAEVKLVDLQEGSFIDEADSPIDISTYDQRKAEGDPQLSMDLNSKQDIASISRRERYSLIYYINDGDKTSAIFPIRGYGLWSTLRGYLALSTADYNTIVGVTFYEHAETPGLGGEVDNEDWKNQWRGKKLFSDDGSSTIQLTRTASGSDNQVDALSGATLTSNGVNNLINFWFGELGFGDLINKLK